MINDSEGKVVCAEAHLCWEHGQYGRIYPPLAVEIAKESGNLYELETLIIEKAVGESREMRKRYGEGFVLYVYSTLSTFCDGRFAAFLQSMADRCKLKAGNVCIRVTGETELLPADRFSELADRARIYGYTVTREERDEYSAQEHSEPAVDKDEQIGQ
ncbi:MAG: EAL domain-containing protein [Lachnospiraceae bacterium]|nr:EAL domain-containing protein [Lachnospiraceae bacterium]